LIDDVAFLGDEFKPSTPRNVRKQIVGNDVLITWNENQEPDVVGYNVYRRRRPWIPLINP